MSDQRHFVSSGVTSSSIPLADRLPLPETLAPALTEDDGSAGFRIDPSLVTRVFDPSISRFRFCFVNLREGCYRITYTPRGISFFTNVYRGTMRVDRSAGSLTISGDLYRLPRFTIRSEFTAGTMTMESPISAVGPVTLGSTEIFVPRPLGIPIYPRKNYYSYLKIVGVQTSPFFTAGPCNLTVMMDEFVYTHPSGGAFDGSFPSTPTRQLTAVLSPVAPPSGFASSYFEGKLFEGSVERGNFSMGWVSSRFRRATLEIDTLQGAVAPMVVGGEDFRTIFATAGWDLGVTYDQTSIAVPAGVTATDCWSNSDLHSLMASVRKATTDLDKEWRTHLVVVPAKIGCGRGRMYDSIGVPREGSASYSDDGYPNTDTSNFGTAEGEKQRDVPRAFIRSAAHEVGHAFNQIHQSFEGGNDNSIMTTSPSVANVLGGPTTGAPGVFPDDIGLSFNETVRNHLVHYPDPVVRPGGHSFLGGSPFSGPEADVNRFMFSADQFELHLDLHSRRLKLGEPLHLHWQLTNRTSEAIGIPSDIDPKGGHVHIEVTNPSGQVKRMGSFIIETDAVTARPLGPGQSASGETYVFWSAGTGFAFEIPGGHRIDVRIIWVLNGVPVLMKASTDVFVDYPTSVAENEVAAALFHREVGMSVALGGGAKHLKEGTARIEKAITEHPDHAACKCILRFAVEKNRRQTRTDKRR